MRMAGLHYSTASYLTHVIKGLTGSYNLLKRLSLAPSTRATINEDSLTSYILQDEAMQEAERPSDLLAQVNYVAPVKQGGRPGDSDDDDAKGGRGRSGSRRLRQGRNRPRNEKQSTSAKNADSSAGGKGRDDKEASCSLVGAVEPTISLAPEAGEDFQAMVADVQANPAVVLLDSGCSHHLMGTKEVFVDLQSSDDVKCERGFNGALQDVQGRGTVALQGEAVRQVLIHDVLYVPGVRANLLLAGQLKENGVKLHEDGDGMLLVSAAGDVLGRASYIGRVLCTDLRFCSAKSTTPTTEVVALRAIVLVTKSTPDRLHARLAHVGMNTIRSSAKHGVTTRLNLKSASCANLPCVSCVGGKLVRHTFPNQGTDADDVLAVVHVDLCGPFRVAAKDGSLYFLLLKDRKTRYVWVRPVAKKLDALLEFVQWLAETERQTKKSQNGMAECEMRTVVESVRTMLLHMGVQHHWWHLTQRQDVWVRNCLERLTLQPGTTPYQLLTGKKPDLSLARVWGCMAQFLVPEQQRGGKLKPKARWGLHLGVLEESKGWELLDIADNRVLTTSDVVFYENMSLEVWKSEHGPASDADHPADGHLDGDTPSDRRGEKSAGTLAVVLEDAEGSNAGGNEAEKADAEESTNSNEVEVGPRRTGRLWRPPEFFVPAAFTTVYDEVDDDLLYDNDEEVEDLPELDPNMHGNLEHRWDISKMTVKEALASWKGKVVKAAMEEEIRRSSSGADYDETYALVSSYITLRIFLGIVVVLDLNLMQLDMKNAFLQSKLDRVLYMYQPDYFNDGTGRVCKLLKSLYDLKKLQLLWYRALDGVLLGAGWKRSQVNTMLYFKVGDDKVTCWVLVYVDNLLAASSSAAMLKELKELLEAAFELREISPVQKYLGLEIVHARSVRKLWLHQQGYADKLRRRFLDEEQNWRTPKTPVGSLQFAATATRPDIAFACSKLGSGLTVRSDQHWREVDRCLAYLANTRYTALDFGGGAESLKLVGYVDTDDAGDKQNRTSMGGYVFVFGEATVSWSSQRIKCATLSLTESEYVAAVKAGKEGRRLRFLLAEFWQLDAGTPTVLRVDNKSAITVAEGMELAGNLKHMERRQAWLQHMVKRGKFSLRYIPTTKQPVDFLTKAFIRP
ncbi:unnamed protein product [Closterium sp. NIES-54]